MRKSQHQEQVNVLSRLRRSRQTGEAPPEIPAHLADTLTSNRYAQPDEFGTLHITERGEQHLHDLQHRGIHRLRSA